MMLSCCRCVRCPVVVQVWCSGASRLRSASRGAAARQRRVSTLAVCRAVAAAAALHTRAALTVARCGAAQCGVVWYVGGLMRGRLARGGPMRGRRVRGGPMRGRLVRGGPMRGRLVRGGLMRGRLVRGGLMRGRLVRGGLMRGGPLHCRSTHCHRTLQSLLKAITTYLLRTAVVTS